MSSTTAMTTKTNFTAGELNMNMYGRGDLSAYENGARKLENVIIHPQGGVSRRKGLKYIASIGSKARLIPFEFNTEQKYLICLTDYRCTIYKNDEAIAVLNTPWSEEILFELRYTQSADTLLVLHPDIAPQKITRNSNEVWRTEAWSFYSDNGLYCCPYYNFCNNQITLTPSCTSGTGYITSDSAFFEPQHVGSYIRINGGCVYISQYTSSQRVEIRVDKALSGTTATKNWKESAFSSLRGWPVCATFHQDRLVIGGSKSLPNHLWMSKSSDLFNFDYGTGLDDEAIDFELLSDQVNAIRDVVSAKNLLIFTSGAEWAVKGDNITPQSLQVVRQTTVGTYGKKAVKPLLINGALVFVSSDGEHLRQFLYSELEDAYQSTDLTLLVKDMISSPTDIAFSPSENVVYVLLADGTASCLTSYRAEQVNAWSRLKTEGKFISVSVLEEDIYFCVYRNGSYYLEKFDDTTYFDCFQKFTSVSPKTNWGNLSIFEGKEVGVVADGYYVGKYTVQNGEITLPEKAQEIYIGFAYEHIVEPLPFVHPNQVPYSPQSARLISAVFRIIGSKGFCVDIGNGYSEVPLRTISAETKFDEPLKIFSGDIELKAIGWNKSINTPLWSIKSDIPVAFTLLSTYLKVKTK